MKLKKTTTMKKLLAAGVALNILACPSFAATPESEMGRLDPTRGGINLKRGGAYDYWFKLGGTLRLDEVMFIGNANDKSNNYPSGANVRNARISLQGGVGHDWEYVLSLEFTGSNWLRDDNFIQYNGFEHTAVGVGRVSPSSTYGADGSNSSSWMPFMERNLANSAFGPSDGLGVFGHTWWQDGALKLFVTGNDVGSRANTSSNAINTATNTANIRYGRDRLAFNGRVHYAPIHNDCDVWQVGLSYGHREQHSHNEATHGNLAETRFQPYPGLRTRNTATEGYSRLVDTGLIVANHIRHLVVDASRQMGPWIIEAEYHDIWVNRLANTTNVTNGDTTNSSSAFAGNAVNGGLHFHGYNVQARYMLTGEHHEYSVKDGSFGRLSSYGRDGAWEVAARYDFVNLNNKDIRGGNQHNVGAALNWYANDNVRIALNYLRTNMHPRNTLPKRHLHLVGMRLQARF